MVIYIWRPPLWRTKRAKILWRISYTRKDMLVPVSMENNLRETKKSLHLFLSGKKPNSSGYSNNIKRTRDFKYETTCQFSLAMIMSKCTLCWLYSQQITHCDIPLTFLKRSWSSQDRMRRAIRDSLKTVIAVM